jgi:hypothetical protein
VHVGIVDRFENGRIKLTKADSGEGRHDGRHHYIDLSMAAEVEGQKVRLSANAAVAVTMEEERSSKAVWGDVPAASHRADLIGPSQTQDSKGSGNSVTTMQLSRKNQR